MLFYILVETSMTNRSDSMVIKSIVASIGVMAISLASVSSVLVSPALARDWNGDWDQRHDRASSYYRDAGNGWNQNQYRGHHDGYHNNEYGRYANNDHNDHGFRDRNNHDWRRDNRNDDDDDIGTAVGIGIGVLGLGLVLSALSSDDKSNAQPVYRRNQIRRTEFGSSDCIETREYQTRVTVGGRNREAFGTACLTRSGQWLQGPAQIAAEW
jgi:hypothetical protein